MDEDEIISQTILQDNLKETLSEVPLEIKRKKIKAEQNRLKKIFKELDKKTFTLVQGLISELAFMSVTLEENRKYIEEHGVKEMYMNGKGQFGFKESVESKNYNAMIKNYTNALKQLIDFLPEKDKKGAGEELLEFIASGKK